jgi:DNA helicase-2/ATP-dependent DNA helicase PcrA
MLVADVDRYDEDADACVMMTIHSAKGLEFPIVFLPGMEDGIFPGMQNITSGSDADMEEERRLAYVAITRAKKKLYIVHTKNRMLYGRTSHNPISRFVTEIPTELIYNDTPRSQDYRPQGIVFGSLAKEQTSYYGQKSSYSSTSTYSSRSNGVGDAITVGKSFSNPIKKSPSATFSEGDRVSHMTFGEGEIISVKPMGADILYEISFDKVGTKKLMATYAKLKKLN